MDQEFATSGNHYPAAPPSAVVTDPRWSWRPATEQDVHTIRQLANEIWTTCYSEMLSAAQIRYMLDWMYSEPRLLTEIRRGVHYRIVEAEARPVGYVAWEILEDRVTIHLNKLYLRREHHGLGWGQALLQAVEDAARAAGARRLELRVNRGNAAARKAYRRAGFSLETAVITDIGSGFVMDDFILTKEVSGSRCGTSAPPSG